MFILLLIIALITLGNSTAGMTTNQTVFALLTTMHSITGDILGWAILATVIGIIIAIVGGIFSGEEAFGCGCIVAVVPLAIGVGIGLVWLFSGGMLNTFSPETGPTSLLFWLWLILAATLGES